MTDTGPPTQVDDVPVVGQRRRDPSEAFPTRPDPSELSPLEQGDDQIGGGDGDGPVDPCADPVTALELNADAAAAEAAREFARRAAALDPPETLNDREWGAFLYRAPDGSIQIGPIAQGLLGEGSVSISAESLDPTTIVGEIHSHRDGQHIPSIGDPNGGRGDLDALADTIRLSGNSSVRMYIVARNQLPAGFTPYNQINVYNRDTAPGPQRGPEVNPEGEPCPGN